MTEQEIEAAARCINVAIVAGRELGLDPGQVLTAAFQLFIIMQNDPDEAVRMLKWELRRLVD